MTVQEANNNNESKEEQDLVDRDKATERASNVPEQATPASAFAPTTTSRVLCVPPAHEWQDGMTFKDKQGAFIAKVLRHEKLGRMASGDQIFRVTLGDEQGNVIAVITRKMENFQDVYVVSSVTPNWPGQPSEPYMNKDKTQDSSVQLYLVGKLYQGTLGGHYTLKSSQGNTILMKASNSNIKWTLICCMGAILFGCCKWKLSFYRPHGGRRGGLAIVRDQAADNVSIAVGESPLLGVCLAYAVDRQTTLAC